MPFVIKFVYTIDKITKFPIVIGLIDSEGHPWYVSLDHIHCLMRPISHSEQSKNTLNVQTLS